LQLSFSLNACYNEILAYYVKKEGGDRVDVTVIESERELGGHSLVYEVAGEKVNDAFVLRLTRVYLRLILGFRC
jgi:hypothetical protein